MSQIDPVLETRKVSKTFHDPVTVQVLKEVSFSVDCAVLPTLCPEMGPAGVGTLKAFDQVRERIHEVAKQVYARTGKGQANAAYAYVLNAVDF